MTPDTCSCCGAIVPEHCLSVGTALKQSDGKALCYKCISTRAASVSDTALFHVLSAKMADGPIRGAVKRMSERLIAQLPEGRLRGVVRRISRRLFVPTTSRYKSVYGSSPKYRLPQTTIQAVAASAKTRTDARNLAIAAVACVVLVIGTILLYIGASRLSAGAATPAPRQAPAAAQAATVRAVPAPRPVARDETAPVVEAAVAASWIPPTPRAAPAQLEKPVEMRPQMAPLIMERAAGVSSKDFRTQLAQESLEDAEQHRRDHPTDTATYQRRLADVVSGFRGTAAAEDAAALLAHSTNAPLVDEMVKPEGPLGWFADWQVGNLEQHAKARMLREFDLRRAILETYPPAPAQPLRLTQKVLVPEDRPYWETAVRGAGTGKLEVAVAVGGKETAPGEVGGGMWRAFFVDLSAYKGQEIELTLLHKTSGDKPCSAFWEEPSFVAPPSAGAVLLSWHRAPAPLPYGRVSENADPRMRYEAALFSIYGALHETGVDAAMDRVEKAKADPVIAPLRARLEQDAECIGLLREARAAGLAGAALLVDGRPFVFTKTDGKTIEVGGGTFNAVTGAAGQTIALLASSDEVKAVQKLAYDDLSLRTRSELTMLGTPSEAMGDIRAALMKLEMYSTNKHGELGKEIRAHLAAARKDTAYRALADRTLAHYEFFRRDFRAQRDFEAIETLCRDKQWREAKTALAEFKAEYLNSYAMERLKTAVDQWSSTVEKETASPILKR